MYFPSYSTFIAQGLALISALQSGLKSQSSSISCPSTQQINEKINRAQAMKFPIEGIPGDGFEYRNANNQRVDDYNGTDVKKLNEVYYQTPRDGRKGSISCQYVDNRGIRFSLDALPNVVDNIDVTKLNNTVWSSFFGNGLKDCGYKKMEEIKILEECKLPLKLK